MNKRDIGLGFAIGGAVGLLVQPILTNVGQSVAFIGAAPSPAIRTSIFLILLGAAPVGIYIGGLLGRLHAVIYQFTKFAAVGTLNTFLNLGALNTLIALTGAASGYRYSLFVLVGFLLATTNSFIWNKFWTFGDKSGVQAGQTLAFYGVTAVGALLNVGVASFIVNAIPAPGLPPAVWANVGGLAGVGASFLWNFLGYKFFIFKHAAGT